MTEDKIIHVLDHGHVRLVDWMGDDKRVVDAARVSYQKGTKTASDDRCLIRYLLRNRHTTPFEKVRFEFHVKLPIFIARQWMRHRTGSFNEISARYSEMEDCFYSPRKMRKQSKSNRQGSSDEIVDVDISSAYSRSYSEYTALLEQGVAREQARMVLPAGIYTEFLWTVDLWNLMHFLSLRLDGHAQKEIRDYGQAILSLVGEHCDLGHSLEAFQDYILDAPTLTKYELDILVWMAKGMNDLCRDPIDIKATIISAIESHEEMSQREKTESKLLAIFQSA
jgi:thymidylate synthase (FAD)